MGWYVQYCGYSDEYSISFSIYFPFSYCPIPVSHLLVYLPLTGPVIPVTDLGAPTLSLALGWCSETGLNWCWLDSQLPPCIPLMHILVLAVHPQSLLWLLFPLHDFLKPHTHGPLLLPSCRYDSACRLAKNGPWKPTRFVVQLACLPTVHRIFPFLLSWV